jgi:peptidyl-prolyl cis-trans isomerase SurA
MVKILLILMSFAFVFMCAVESHASVLLDRVVAIVNKEVITWSELYKMMEFEASEQVRALSEEERLKMFRESESVFVGRIIDTRLHLHEARRLGLDAGPEEIGEAVENVKKKYSMTQADFIESLKHEGLTLDEYKKRLTEQIMISKVIGHEIRNKVIVTDADVNNYLDNNKEIFSGGDAYKIRQIFFRKPPAEEKRTLEERALQIVDRLKAGEEFSSLAMMYSQDVSGKSGGDLGMVKKDYLSKEFVAALSSMNAGDISAPFWTDNGLHIIKLDTIISEKNMGVVKDEIRKQLSEEQFMERYKNWIDDLRERAYIEIKL